MAGKTRTHYEILGVPRGVPQDEVRRAYVAAARKWHPDRFVGRSPEDAERAEQAMRRVNQAWETLGDSDRRILYDQELDGRSSLDASVSGIRVDDGITRIDPRLLDPDFLAARRQAQFDEISNRSSVAIRVFPVVAVLTLLVGIFVFTAYASDQVRGPTSTTVPGPSLGTGIEANDCVDVISGPALLEVPCTATADGKVIGAHLGDGVCPTATRTEIELTNGVFVCLAAV